MSQRAPFVLPRFGAASLRRGWFCRGRRHVAVPYIVVLGHATAVKSAIATSIAAISRQVGLAIGVTLAFVVVTAAGFSGQFRSESFTAAFVLGAIGASAALLAAL